MEKRTIKAYIGYKQEIEVTVFICDDWYVQYGGNFVNQALDRMDLFEGCHLDDVQDFTGFSWNDPIESLEQLEIAVNS